MDVRRTEGRPRLRPGDVLLLHGPGALSWAIRRFDEADVDRAAIALDAYTVAEVSERGPRERPWDQVVAESRFAYIRRLPDDIDAAPVVDRARALLAGERRSVDHRWVQLAVLSMTRRLPLASVTLRSVVQAVLDRASVVVDVASAEGHGLLPSSHLVYRCFDESGDPRSALSIMFPSVHPPATPSREYTVSGESTMIDWAMARPEPIVVPRPSGAAATADEELEAAIAAFAIEDSPQDPFAVSGEVVRVRRTDRLVSDEELLVSAVRFRDQMNRLAMELGADPWGTFRTAADLVTPADLRYSPSLVTIGSIRPERRRAMIDS